MSPGRRSAPIIVPVQTRLLTAEEFLALPAEPGVERWLIDGQLRERRFLLIRSKISMKN